VKSENCYSTDIRRPQAYRQQFSSIRKFTTLHYWNLVYHKTRTR